MVCPRCAHSTTVPTSRCPACGATYADGGVVTLDTPIDTTGLPPTATAAPSTRLDGGTTTIGPTVAADTVNGSGADAAHATGGALRVGQSFGSRFHIIKVLGVGGMGAVYQAWDAELNVGVALKVIRTDARHRSSSSEAQKRFKQE